ncbi:hypothetical protein [Ancylobacter defluvii]|uniref:Uncharacterized protein n=1 Tax=Ancylobacter defluvii TaxID=1282440 RepID=A0A9W6JS37_9HYPH|nr:hypothetical protein [Ancylobacter defluvii]MBS7590145.1 hypothetical protein [Ancylobacter defluvii]GLK82771.1 hypothetical protein GCM10017653_08400 [Ancylobacter defluvii]
MCDASNDNVPSTATVDATPAKPKWREADPELAAASAALADKHRKEMIAAAKLESRACRRAGAQARHRQLLGESWDGEADNDNRTWPLAKALIADGKEHLLRAAMEYRRIEASANSGAQLGGTAIGLEPVQIDQRTWIRPDGQIVYKGECKLTAAKFAEVLPTQASRASDGMMRTAAPVPKAWDGDAKVNARVDDPAQADATASGSWSAHRRIRGRHDLRRDARAGWQNGRQRQSGRGHGRWQGAGADRPVRRSERVGPHSHGRDGAQFACRLVGYNRNGGFKRVI